MMAILRASGLRLRMTPPRIRMRMSALGFVLFLNPQHTKQRPYLLVEDNITHKGAGRETEGSEYEKQRI